MPKLRPLGDKILVKRVEAESKTKSGIVLPDTAKEKPKRGKVLSVGEGKRLDTGERFPSAAKSFPSAKASVSTPASAPPFPSRKATKSSSPATPAPKSSSTAKSS